MIVSCAPVIPKYWNWVLLFLVILTIETSCLLGNESDGTYNNSSRQSRSSLWSPYNPHNGSESAISEEMTVRHSTTSISINKDKFLKQKEQPGPTPIFSNIRHYRSRKSFTRIIPSTQIPSQNEGQLNDNKIELYQNTQPEPMKNHRIKSQNRNRKAAFHYGREITSSNPINTESESKNKSQIEQKLEKVKDNSSRNRTPFEKLKTIKNLLLHSNETNVQQLSSKFHTKEEEESYIYSSTNPEEYNEIPLNFVPGDFPTFKETSENDDIYDDYNNMLSDIVTSKSENTSESSVQYEEDIVTKFLSYVEDTVENCTAGTEFTLGKGVVGSYGRDRFRLEAEVAVNRANMLTRLWKYAREVMSNEYLLHASLFSMVEFDDDIFAAGNCYDKLEYKNYTLYCPFAYRLPEGNIRVKDLAVEYKYLSNTSEFFYAARNNAERVIKNFNQFTKGYNSYTYNESTHTDVSEEIILNVTYGDGIWSAPYFDCGGGNIWMMTYTVPFFDYRNQTYFFKGTSGIDIDLRRVDIDQCPLPSNSTEENIFAASDKCKKTTTMCHAIKGLGFRRGSYRCYCKDGYYFPNISSPIKYFNGSLIEEEYEKRLQGKISKYDELEAFECLLCPYGCDTCVDDRPCVVSLNWLMRSGILILQVSMILILPIVGLFTWKYSEVKVIRAASPVLLRFIVLGAFFIYCTILVMYPSPSIITCTIRVWCREIGFSLAYGALMLKTWRISVIFRVRSAKAVKITDLDLMKRLGIIVGIFAALLVIRTLVAPPIAIVSLTADDLKAWLCKTDWWDHSFTIMELLLLVWGIRLCIVVRKAPSEFNESKFISMAIYNEFLLSLFLNISMLFLQSPANPDLLYIIFFCHVQLTMTLLLCLIFGSKAYLVFRGQGKGGNSLDEGRQPTTKFISTATGRRSGTASGPPQPKPSSLHAGNSISGGTGKGGGSDGGLNSIASSVPHIVESSPNSKFPIDIQDEFRQIFTQLEALREKNLKLGNQGLIAKIQAMRDAADTILKNPTTQVSSTPLANAAAQLCSLLSPEPSQINHKTTVCLNENGESALEERLTVGCLEFKEKQKPSLANPTEKECHPSSSNPVEKVDFEPEVGIKSGMMIKDEDELEYMDLVEEPEDVKQNLFLLPPGSDRTRFISSTEEDPTESASESCEIIHSQTLKGNEPSESETKKRNQPLGNKSSSNKIILDLDDKSRFTEEITV